MLEFSPEVIAAAKAIHPPQPAKDTALLKCPLLGPPPAIIFEEIDGRAIKEAALRTRGGAGPSGGDADHWKRQLTALGDASVALCEAMAGLARSLCVVLQDPEMLEPLLASRLAMVDKCPGARPLGIGEVARRIVAKAVLGVLKQEIKSAAGNINLSAGQQSAVEAIFHVVVELFGADEMDAVLLVDAEQGSSV